MHTPFFVRACVNIAHAGGARAYLYANPLSQCCNEYCLSEKSCLRSDSRDEPRCSCDLQGFRSGQAVLTCVCLSHEGAKRIQTIWHWASLEVRCSQGLQIFSFSFSHVCLWFCSNLLGTCNPIAIQRSKPFWARKLSS